MVPLEADVVSDGDVFSGGGRLCRFGILSLQSVFIRKVFINHDIQVVIKIGNVCLFVGTLVIDRIILVVHRLGHSAAAIAIDLPGGGRSRYVWILATLCSSGCHIVERCLYGPVKIWVILVFLWHLIILVLRLSRGVLVNASLWIILIVPTAMVILVGSLVVICRRLGA